MKRAGIFWMLVWLACGPAWGLTADEQIRFADGIYLRGFYETAVGEYLALLRDYPDSEHVAAALYRTGECYRQMGNQAGAERFYKRLTTEFPKSEQAPRAELRRAELAIAEERHADAAVILNQLLLGGAPEETAAAASYYLGYSRWKAGDRKGAGTAYARMLEEHGQSPYASYAALDLAALHAGDKIDDAQMTDWFEKAVETAATPSAKAEALFRWGDWAYRQERYQVAADTLQSLLVEFPEERRARDARLATAWSLYYLERTAEAMELAEKLVASASDAETAASGVYLRANCLRKLNRDGEALTDYGTVVRDYPGTRFAGRAAYEIMVTHFKRGEHEKALVAAPVQPDGANAVDVLWMRAECERALGRTDAARGRYEALGEGSSALGPGRACVAAAGRNGPRGWPGGRGGGALSAGGGGVSQERCRGRGAEGLCAGPSAGGGCQGRVGGLGSLAGAEARCRNRRRGPVAEGAWCRSN
jgi:TolA-binding protein